MYIKGPALYSPSSLFSRYLIEQTTSEYLIAMATKPTTHIQKIAPGPPLTIPIATPIIFPVPIVPLRAAKTA